jgi:hypothetical protein
MILKASTRGNGSQFARYLLDNSKNDQARVLEIRGTASPDNLYDSLTEVSAYGQLTRSEKPILQVVVSPAVGEDMEMNDNDWRYCLDTIEKKIEFDGQPRGAVIHDYDGRRHMHAFWGRYDPDTETMRPIPYIALNLRQAREEIEKELEHEHLLSWREKKANEERQIREEEQNFDRLKADAMREYQQTLEADRQEQEAIKKKKEFDEMVLEIERIKSQNTEIERGYSL